jgi:hypothetical protein
MTRSSTIVSIKRWFLPLVLLTMVPFFFYSGGLDINTELERSILNFGHILFFALAIIALRNNLDMRTWPHWLAISIAVFLVSIIIEYIQHNTGRTRSWNDVERNLIGAWVALFWLNPPSTQVWTGRFIATGLFISQLVMVSQAGLTEYRLQNTLPILSDFENDYEISWWQGRVSMNKERAWHGNQSMNVNLSTQTYSGVRLSRIPGNWSDYSELKFEIYNPGLLPMPLTLRINDEAHERSLLYQDRFNSTFIIEHGWNLIQFSLDTVRKAPSGRDMDMSKITHLELFAFELDSPREITLDYLRLR